MSSRFDKSLKERSAKDYADFLLPCLTDDSLVLDIGCGQGTMTLGLAQAVGHVIGVDLAEEEFAKARLWAAEHEIENVEFRVGSVEALDFPSDHFDGCLCHSMLETLDSPLDALVEIRRALKPGGVVGVACVEYGGLILAGPGEELLGASTPFANRCGSSRMRPIRIAGDDFAASWRVPASIRSSRPLSTSATAPRRRLSPSAVQEPRTAVTAGMRPRRGSTGSSPPATSKPWPAPGSSGRSHRTPTQHSRGAVLSVGSPVVELRARARALARGRRDVVVGLILFRLAALVRWIVLRLRRPGRAGE